MSTESLFADCMKTEVDVVPTTGNADTKPGCLLQIHPLSMKGGLVHLRETAMSIGRDESCEISLRDQSISRNHASICHMGTDSYVQDLGSTNGTWVNDVRIPSDPFRLVAGDRIRVGTHVFKYLSANDIETQYHAAAYAMMTRDSSTGTLNKPSLLEYFDREISRAVRRKRSLSLILFDVDQFKPVNDQFGHLAGDQILHGVCSEIRKQLRNEELLARFGGDEFAILLPEETLESASNFATRCREAVESATFDTCTGPIHVTISLGISELAEVMDMVDPPDDKPGAAEVTRSIIRREMIELCDERLYSAKAGGRNQAVSE